MLCPEVWEFKVPESTFQVNKPCVGENLIQKHIDSFRFTHSVSVVIPDALKVSESLITQLQENCEYYQIIDLNLAEILKREFLCCFIKKGQLSLLSLNTRIDKDNCLAVTTSGELILNLNRNTYQTVGLEGKPSHFTQKLKDRYIVTIDLKDDCLREGKSKHEKIKRALNVLGKFTVVVSWQPPDDSICASSIAKYFFCRDYDVKTCRGKFHSHTVYSAKVPLVDLEEIDEEAIGDFSEWLGMVAIDGDLSETSPESYVNTYETPEPNIALGQVKFLQWKGFFTAEKIGEFLNSLKEYCKSQGKLWVSCFVQGFSDSPVVWKNEEHHYYSDGDNGYLIIFSDEKYVICSQKCSRKRYK